MAHAVGMLRTAHKSPRTSGACAHLMEAVVLVSRAARSIFILRATKLRLYLLMVKLTMALTLPGSSLILVPRLLKKLSKFALTTGGIITCRCIGVLIVRAKLGVFRPLFTIMFSFLNCRRTVRPRSQNRM